MNNSEARHVQSADNLAQLVNIALKILSQRVMTVMSLLLNAGVCSWAMYTESWLRLAVAAVFAVASWCTLHLKPPGGNDP